MPPPDRGGSGRGALDVAQLRAQGSARGDAASASLPGEWLPGTTWLRGMISGSNLAGRKLAGQQASQLHPQTPRFQANSKIIPDQFQANSRPGKSHGKSLALPSCAAPPERLQERPAAAGLGGQRFGAWRSPVSALVWGTRGRGFKSRRSDHFSRQCFHVYGHYFAEIIFPRQTFIRQVHML